MSNKTRTQDDVITINDRYSIWRDQYQWFLYDFGDSRLIKDGPKLKKLPQPTYHPKLSQLVNHMVELQTKDAGELKDILILVEELNLDIFLHMQEVTKPWGKTPADKAEISSEESSKASASDS